MDRQESVDRGAHVNHEAAGELKCAPGGTTAVVAEQERAIVVRQPLAELGLERGHTHLVGGGLFTSSWSPCSVIAMCSMVLVLSFRLRITSMRSGSGADDLYIVVAGSGTPAG